MPDEQPDPFVIRGGVFPTAKDLLDAVEQSLDDGYGAVASCWVGSLRQGETYDEAVRRICAEADIRNNKVRVASLRGLEAHLPVVQDQTYDEPPSHHNVIFSEPPTLEEAEKFVSCFADPIPNPAKNRAS